MACCRAEQASSSLLQASPRGDGSPTIRHFPNPPTSRTGKGERLLGARILNPEPAEMLNLRAFRPAGRQP
eukprot:7332444-Alexandrium_andersonii.AAC.1